ncbi:MAG: hypothetical protein ACYDHY_07215 [Acidiferrobacterales bacterium]
MADFQAAAEMGPPVPDNLEDALQEIYRLRNALFSANAKLAMTVEKADQVKRSLVGEVKHYRELLGLERKCTPSKAG